MKLGNFTRGPGTTAEFLRFVLVRGVCTALSYGLYVILLRWIGYQAAYVFAFVFGIVLAYVVNAAFVFQQPMAARSALQFPLVYLLQFGVTLLLLHVSVEYMGIAESFALAIAIVITIPVTFVLSKWIFRSA